MRVFDDGGPDANLWFELAPGLFWCGDNVTDAKDTRYILPTCGASLDQVLTIPGVKEVTP